MRFAVLILLFSCIACRQPSDNQLSGLWELKTFEVQDSTGEWGEYPWNKGGTGYLLYDDAGHAALHITPKNYQNLVMPSSTSIDSIDNDSLKSAYASMALNYNYVATYTIDHKKHIISHTRLSHSRPEDWGKTVEREFQFVGQDTLLMFPVEGFAKRRLTWVRSSMN